MQGAELEIYPHALVKSFPLPDLEPSFGSSFCLKAKSFGTDIDENIFLRRFKNRSYDSTNNYDSTVGGIIVAWEKGAHGSEVFEVLASTYEMNSI
jgi:hypothetical protein